jgi:hypothetical protein
MLGETFSAVRGFPGGGCFTGRPDGLAMALIRLPNYFGASRRFVLSESSLVSQENLTALRECGQNTLV